MSQIDEHSKEIDGHKYSVLMLDPMVSTDLLSDLMAIIGPSLASIGGVANKADTLSSLLDGDAAEADASGFERAVLAFFERFDKRKQREIIDTLMKVSFVELVPGSGKNVPMKEVFSVHFKGKIATIYKWAAFALQVQYKDFFSGIASAIGPVVRKLSQGRFGSQSTSSDEPISGA